MAWEISLHEDVEHWYLSLCRDDPATADGIADAIEQLAAVGPALGRPLVDRIHGSRHHNMKELRPPSTGASEVRLLFVFDPEREAVFLVAGDKSGRWETWYRDAVPLADKRFDEHLQALRAGPRGVTGHGEGR
ncbi:MAG: type II toxin-antitoxin system RelE/ParE family toxin [Pseudonocardia sp.]|nr:type II toxin-antitoxin system RelE/ParE family toxin [Pseudonocardia sp.]